MRRRLPSRPVRSCPIGQPDYFRWRVRHRSDLPAWCVLSGVFARGLDYPKAWDLPRAHLVRRGDGLHDPSQRCLLSRSREDLISSTAAKTSLFMIASVRTRSGLGRDQLLFFDRGAGNMRGHVLDERYQVFALARHHHAIDMLGRTIPDGASGNEDLMRTLGAGQREAFGQLDFRQQLNSVAHEYDRLARGDEAGNDALRMRVGAQFLYAARTSGNDQRVIVRAQRLADLLIHREIQAPAVALAVPAVHKATFRADGFDRCTGFQHFALNGGHNGFINTVRNEYENFAARKLDIHVCNTPLFLLLILEQAG